MEVSESPIPLYPVLGNQKSPVHSLGPASTIALLGFPGQDLTIKVDMKLLQISFLAASLALPSFALPTFPITFTDKTAAQDPNDVMGDPLNFDITQLSFTAFNAATKTFTAKLNFNYGGGQSLSAFTIGSGSVSVGDLLISNGTNRYFVPLVTRGTLDAGDLYSTTAYLTAQSVHGSGSGRPTENVWGSTTGAVRLGNGTVSSVSVGGSGNPNKLEVTLNFVGNDAFITNFANSTVSFAAATCANDIINGVVPANAPIPEPGTWAMLGAGLAAVGLLRRRQA